MTRKSITLVLLLLWSPAVFGGTLILKRAWIEKFKDRATIDASFTVDHAHKKPNAAKDDGDMHVAGRAPQEVGLPMVAEVVNAAGPGQQQAIKLIHGNEGSGKFVAISGAWRLWFEHPAVLQTQFANVPKAGNTNPDHSFQIHPVSKFAGEDISSSFTFVPGFDGYDAKKAFGAYEKLSISIRSTATAVTLDSKRVFYNYVHFKLRLVGNPFQLKDGGFAVFADIEDEEAEGDDAIAEKVRMIFVPATPPWKKIQNASEGNEFQALGIPRVNLNAIAAFVQAAKNAAVTRKLPYEIIVVGMK